LKSEVRILLLLDDLILPTAFRFGDGSAELKICPGGMEPVSSSSCLENLYKRNPCKGKIGDALYECLCSFRPDGTFRNPYDGSLTRIYTCKGWRLAKADKCPAGQVMKPIYLAACTLFNRILFMRV
jgi:hypothetical protein